MRWRFTQLLILSGLLALVAAPAHASIIDLPVAEKTHEIIYTIFSDNILGAMSVVLNLGCILFAGIIIGYTALSGVLNSAHEGNVMGKAYNSMWVPVRSTIAIALMLPISESGFSTVQHGVLWIAEAGAGLASATWSAALDYMENTGKLYSPPSHRQGAKLAAAMLRSSGCLEAVNRSSGNANNVRRWLENKNQSDNYRTTVRYSGVGDSPSMWDVEGYGDPVTFDSDLVLPIDVCGRVDLTLQRPDDSHLSAPIKKEFMEKVQIAFASLDEAMYQLGRNLVNEAPAMTLTGMELHNAASEYDAAVNDALNYATKKLNEAREADTNWQDEARAMGFVGAGAWYMDIMRLHQETLDFAAISPTTKPPKTTEIIAFNVDYPGNMAAVESYLKDRLTVDQYGDTVKASEQSEDEDILDKLAKKLQVSIRGAVAAQSDPTAALQDVGHGIITTLEVIGGGALTAKAVAKGAESSFWLKIVPGGGAAAGAADAIASTLFDVFKIVAGVILIPAAFLAFYLPLVPFILWIMGLTGWVVLFIESLIAAPIWAAAHSIPEGQGVMGNHAKAGYMILLSLFLRPTLMLFGLFASFFVNIIIGKIALVAYMKAVLSTSGDHAIGIASIVAYTLILAGLMVMVAHRSFGLIHEIPDKILRYIGGGIEQLGEASNEAQGRTIIAGVATRAERTRNLPKGGPGRGGDKPGASNQPDSVRNANKTNDQLSPAAK